MAGPAFTGVACRGRAFVDALCARSTVWTGSATVGVLTPSEQQIRAVYWTRVGDSAGVTRGASGWRLANDAPTAQAGAGHARNIIACGYCAGRYSASVWSRPAFQPGNQPRS